VSRSSPLLLAQCFCNDCPLKSQNHVAICAPLQPRACTFPRKRNSQTNVHHKPTACGSRTCLRHLGRSKHLSLRNACANRRHETCLYTRHACLTMPRCVTKLAPAARTMLLQRLSTQIPKSCCNMCTFAAQSLDLPQKKKHANQCVSQAYSLPKPINISNLLTAPGPIQASVFTKCMCKHTQKLHMLQCLMS
jgi:hypothetical protein